MQIQSLSASRFWITSLKPVYENGARPDSSMMFNGSVERKEITKHPRLNFEKNTFSTAHIVLSSRSSSLDGRVSQHQTWSRSMIWTSDGFWKSLTCACGRRPYGDGYIDWWKGTSEPETMVLPIKLNGDLCEKLPLNQSNAYFGGWHSEAPAILEWTETFQGFYPLLVSHEYSCLFT